jgi:hypothetical protein
MPVRWSILVTLAMVYYFAMALGLDAVLFPQ